MRGALKPQDVVVALKLAVHPDRDWPGYHPLAAELHMSASELHKAIARLNACRLHSPTSGRVHRRNLLEFLAHGLQYVFPAEEGDAKRGVPTAWSVEPLRSRLSSTEGAVWPDPRGPATGRAITPLYDSVPKAAREDRDLHEVLALVDAIRAGRARERALAIEQLERRFA